MHKNSIVKFYGLIFLNIINQGMFRYKVMILTTNLNCIYILKLNNIFYYLKD